jgi:HK97 family phage major capsid protein
MQSIQALRERRNTLAKSMKDMLDANPAKFEAAQVEKWDASVNEIDDIDAQIGRVEALAKLAVDNHDAGAVAEAAARAAHGKSGQGKEVFNKWLRGGDKAVSAEEWAAIRNTMSTTTTTEGGYTVPTEVATEVVEALLQYGGMRAVSEIIRTSDGRDINYPTSDGTGEVGELIAQNTTATSADPSFSVATLSAYKYSSKIIAVPFELLQDTTIDMEGFVRRRIVQRLGRITNTHFTTGSGTGQPKGIVTAAASGKVGTTGQTLTVLYNDLLDLVHSVDPAYRADDGDNDKIGFMMNDSSLKVIRKLVDGQSRPLWVPSWDAGIAKGAPDQLMGYPVFINQDIAAMAANAKSILFGNFGYYTIRDVMDMQLFRFTDSAYTKLGQVGFLAWMRAGGTYVGVSGAVKYYANSAT